MLLGAVLTRTLLLTVTARHRPVERTIEMILRLLQPPGTDAPAKQAGPGVMPVSGPREVAPGGRHQPPVTPGAGTRPQQWSAPEGARVGGARPHGILPGCPRRTWRSASWTSSATRTSTTTGGWPQPGSPSSCTCTRGRALASVLGGGLQRVRARPGRPVQRVPRSGERLGRDVRP
jgi:hypothetical protein